MKRSISFLTFAALLFTAGLQAQQWTAASSMGTGRVLHSSTSLANGKVLVAGGTGAAAGSVEIYDPATGNWTATGGLNTPRYNHVAVRLHSGKVLVAGGEGLDRRNLASAELYHPETGVWTTAAVMNAARELPSATVLSSGHVLLAGGEADDNSVGNTAELYDPIAGTWTSAGAMSAPREGHTATLLPNGNVVVAGGFGGTLTSPVLHASSEVFDPATRNWTAAGNLSGGIRVFPKAVLLMNGKALVVGGSNFVSAIFNTAELFDPATGQWTATGSMATARQAHTLTLLPNGKVLVVGKSAGQSGAEVYDPEAGTWSATALPAGNVLLNHAATLLAGGKVLITGGNGSLVTASLYDAGSPAVGVVSAAHYLAQISGKQIASAFGQNIATVVADANTVPLPTSLAGVSARVKDVAGIERMAPLFFVSPTQVNFQIPAGTALGQAYVSVLGSDGRTHTALVDIQTSAAAIISANNSGAGPAAALDAITFTPAPFRARQANGDPNIISVFLTGLGADVTDGGGNVSSSVEARLDGQVIVAQYAGPAPGFIGLNQVNIFLPSGISSGVHNLTLSRGGVTSNVVTLAIQ